MLTVIRRVNLFRLLTTILLLALLAVPAFGGASESAPGQDPGSPSPIAPAADPKGAYQDIALFIAGVSNGSGALAAQEQHPPWPQYAKSMSQTWGRYDQRHLAPMRAWAAQELAAAAAAATVFYPFSGPDFVNMYTLFPRAKTYLMIALEPVGVIPDFTAGNKGHFFANLKRSLYDLLQLNFFITEKLKNSLSKSELKGVLPVLMFFLARGNARVLDVRYWRMEPDGAIEESPASGPRVVGREDIAGVRLDFVRAGSQEPQTLYYFRFNLRNDSLQGREDFVSFLKGFAPFTTFAKAASYLMHKPHYSAIRQLILDHSLFVLQGDSAIPLKYFPRTAWNLKFFGNYASPINLFKNYRQRDLAEIYRQDAEVLPLPFGIDYLHRVNTSNLMFAAKKLEAAAGNSK